MYIMESIIHSPLYGHFYLNHSHSHSQQRMSYIDRRHKAQWQPCWHYKTPTSRDYNHSRRRWWALEVQAAGERQRCVWSWFLIGIREEYRNRMHIWTFGRCSKDEEKELLLTTGLLMQVLRSRSVFLWIESAKNFHCRIWKKMFI